MKRTDEAFKNEVFRRYGVQKRNQRNYFFLALSPLVLMIILGSLIFLPNLSGLLDLTPADDPEGTATTTEAPDHRVEPERTPPAKEELLGNYLTYSFVAAEVMLTPSSANYSCPNFRAINELAEMLSQITVILQEDSPKLTPNGPVVTFTSQDGTVIEVRLDSSNHLNLHRIIGEKTDKQWWFTVTPAAYTQILDYLEGLMDEAPTPPTNPPTLADFLTEDVDQISVYAQFGADQRYDVKDDANNWFASLMENLRTCQFQACDPSVNTANAGKPTIVLTKDDYSLYLLLNDQTDSIITHLYDSTGTLVDTGHYTTDNSLSFGRTISWANTSMLSGNHNVNEASALRKILAEKMNVASFRLYALQDATFACQNADEMQRILNCIEKMSFTEIPAIDLACMGAVVTFTMGDGRTATLSFDDTGYLHLLVKDAGGKTLTSQWYEFSLESPYDSIHSCLSGILHNYPANVYPTPGNLYTQVYPTAGILNLYPKYLSSYTQPSDYEIGEIMRRIHELKLTECAEIPDYVFDQPVVELWLPDCVFRVIIDGKEGYIRTFVEEFDQTTLLEAKLYKGSVKEIAALTAYLEELTSGPPPYVKEVHIAPLDIFRAFLNQEISSLELSSNNQSALSYQYTDAKVISAVMEKIKSLSLTNNQEAPSIDSPDSSWVYIKFANGNYLSLMFDTSGYVEYYFKDDASGITYSGKYRLSAADVSAFAKFIDPYLDAEPSDEVPLMKDLLGNTALQNFLSGIGVSVDTTPEEAPQEIERMLADHGGPAGGFFADGQSFLSPDGVNLDYLLYDYYGSDRSPLSDAERLAIVKAGVHPEAVANMEFSRFTLEEVRGILEDNLAYLPAFADDLHNELIKYTVYAPETDCYYQFHTDYLGGACGINARLYRTDRADTVIVLFSDYFYGDMHVAAFRMVNGEYRLYGYTPI